jgi:two-component system, OmpR family, KDP operon response regulator KdpE
MKVLLVEDDETTAESIKLCFEIYEPASQLVITDKGQEAIDLLKTGDFHIAIIDLGLPDIDGTVVIEQLRAFSLVPVIVLSARHGSDNVSRALTLGADDYVTKPFDYRNLLLRLHNLNKKERKAR